MSFLSLHLAAKPLAKRMHRRGLQSDDSRRANLYDPRESKNSKNRGVALSKAVAISVVATLIAVSMASQAGVASATPFSNALAIKNGVKGSPESLQSGGKAYRIGWREAGWHSERWGRPPYYGYGFAAGATFGGWLVAPYILPGAYQYSDPNIDGPRSEAAVEYCMHRFKSYDPSSGTYLGHGGSRRPCP
jgi:BA14K-like protein